MRRNGRDLDRIRNRRRNRPPASTPSPLPVAIPIPSTPPPVAPPAPAPAPTPAEVQVAVTLPLQVASAIGRPTLTVQGPAADLSIIGVILNTGCYEPHVMAAMISILPLGGSFVDVGANIGVLSTLAALRVGDQGTVLAVEASPATYPFLVRNLAATGCPGVIPVNRGAWDAPGTLRFCHLAHITGGSHVTTTGTEEGQVYAISCAPLDTLAAAAGLHRVDLIKIDVEGSEIRVLNGASQILSDHRPPIIIEFNQFTLQQHAATSAQELYDCLRDYGYHMKILMEDGTTLPVTAFERMEQVSRQWTLRLDVLCEHAGEPR
ncbi:MAG: methyltransferase [Firmicutes bacterium]|nr:methyltransferase [Bacillota bacterium]